MLNLLVNIRKQRVEKSGSKPRVAQPKGVGNYRYGAEAHGGCCKDRLEEKASKWIQQSSGNGDTEQVVDEGKEKILPDVAHRSLAKLARAQDGREIALQQRDVSAFHRNIRARSHGNADIGLGQRRSVI